MTMAYSYHHISTIEEDVKNQFTKAHLPQEYKRASLVKALALKLAAFHGIDKEQVAAAALLHNISRLIPETQYLQTAEEYGVEILPEERKNPYLLHQKISRILAVAEFNISDKEILNAINCHTTLRPSATLLDKIIFLASKQSNDELKEFIFGTSQIPNNIKELNEAVYSCLFNLLNNTDKVLAVHPWAKQALNELKEQTA